MSNEIIKVLDALAEKLGIAVDWTEQNVLPYAQMLCEKYITYQTAISIAWIIIGLMLCVVAVLCIRKFKHILSEFHKSDRRYTTGEEDAELAVLLLGAAIFIAIGLSLLFYFTFNLVTCLTFPEKLIFDYIQTFNA